MLDWKKSATRLLRVEMERTGVSFKELSRRLEPIGVNLQSQQLSNKVNRGTFSFTFFLQCMKALNVEVIRLFDSALQAKGDHGHHSIIEKSHK
jgi:hypothetical protein